MPVDTTPRMGMGCDGDCNFYFEIEHLPAKSIFNTIKRREEGQGTQIFVSGHFVCYIWLTLVNTIHALLLYLAHPC